MIKTKELCQLLFPQKSSIIDVWQGAKYISADRFILSKLNSVPEAYLEPSRTFRTSTMKRFYENSYLLLAVNYFCNRAPS